MAKTVVSIALDTPATDPAINEGQTFSMDATATLTGSHTTDFDVHYQYDQGIGTWIDIPVSGSELTTADTNPLANHGSTAIPTITVNAETGSANTYSVRIRTVDNNDGSAEDLSGTQTVTVSAPSGFQSAWAKKTNTLIGA